MLRLAVATQAETFERMGPPLAERDIAVGFLPTAERTVPLDSAPQVPSFDVGFVFPPRLAEGGVADACHAVPWVNDREAVLRSRQKGETLARLATADVPVPDTVVVSNPVSEADLVEVFARFDPPVVLKPNVTSRGAGVTTAHDVDSFLGVCDYLDLVHDYRATGDRSFLVQEFLPDARDFRAMVVDGAVVGGVERVQSDEISGDTGASHGGRWKRNVHRGAQAVAVDLPETVRDRARAAADALEIPWLGVDVLVTDNRAVVTETNARPTIDEASKYDDGFWDDLAALVRAQVE